MSRTWILIADRSGARLFEQTREHMPIRLHTTFEHPAGRLREGEIYADRPGRVHDRMGDQRHGVGREESGVAHVTAGFTREMADFLRTSRLNHHYDQLVLVAGPKLLGGLRQALDRDTAALVSASLPRDLQEVSEHDLPAHLKDVLELPQA